MRKMIVAFLLTSLVFLTLVFSLNAIPSKTEDTYKVAMVTDFSDVNDASFNQACFEGAKEWANKNNVVFNYYKPSDISLTERVKSLNLAIDRGYNVILCPGFALAEAIAEVAPKHLDVKFVGLDIDKDDFKDFELTENIVVYNYREEIAGFLAGYAAAKDGFKNLGFLGGMAVKPVKRFGYGYFQGIDAYAQESKTHIEARLVFGNRFYGDGDVFKRMDTWYKSNNVEVVFSCGGSIYTSVALAAKENNGHMIGVDIDQGPIIDEEYAEGICITSAMKDIKQTVIKKLDDIYSRDIWENGIINLGLVSSENLDLNYVKLPTSDWRLKEFSIEDYKTLVNKIMSNEIVISREIDSFPEEVQFSEYTHFVDEGQI